MATAAGFAFIDRKTPAVFLVRRTARVSEPGTWGAPGGTLEPDEHALEAAQRECIEEIDILPKHFLQSYISMPYGRGKRYVLFVAYAGPRHLSQAYPDGVETDDVGWFRLDREPPADAHPGIKRVWRYLQKIANA